MAYEKLWKLIAPKSFASNGGTDGRVVIADTVHFKVKQLVILKSSSIPQETYFCGDHAGCLAGARR